MSILDEIKKRAIEKKQSQTHLQKEISSPLLDRVADQIAGAGVWCRASWASGCDAT